jgi:hypothetical protein
VTWIDHVQQILGRQPEAVKDLRLAAQSSNQTIPVLQHASEVTVIPLNAHSGHEDAQRLSQRIDSGCKTLQMPGNCESQDGGGLAALVLWTATAQLAHEPLDVLSIDGTALRQAFDPTDGGFKAQVAV